MPDKETHSFWVIPDTLDSIIKSMRQPKDIVENKIKTHWPPKSDQETIILWEIDDSTYVPNELQRKAVYYGLQKWANTTGIKFIKKTKDSDTKKYKTLTFQFEDQVSLLNGAFKVAGITSNSLQDGDVTIRLSTFIGQSNQRVNYKSGRQGFRLIIHEVGHALGLGHPTHYHERDFKHFMPEYLMDNASGSIMSYIYKNHINFSGEQITKLKPHIRKKTSIELPSFLRDAQSITVPKTPSPVDIAIAQSIWGTNSKRLRKNTKYNFTPNRFEVKTIYDAGGHDVFDLTKMTKDTIVDLRPGHYSSIGGSISSRKWQLENTKTKATTILPIKSYHDAIDNISIAFGTVIEDVKGGKGNDSITGNAADNNLIGFNGNDIFTGLEGNDRLIGGKGHDIYRFTENWGHDKVLDSSGTLDFSLFDRKELSFSVVKDNLLIKQKNNSTQVNSFISNGSKFIVIDKNGAFQLDYNPIKKDFRFIEQSGLFTDKSSLFLKNEKQSDKFYVFEQNFNEADLIPLANLVIDMPMSVIPKIKGIRIQQKKFISDSARIMIEGEVKPPIVSHDIDIKDLHKGFLIRSKQNHKFVDDFAVGIIIENQPVVMKDFKVITPERQTFPLITVKNHKLENLGDFLTEFIAFDNSEIAKIEYIEIRDHNVDKDDFGRDRSVNLYDIRTTNGPDKESLLSVKFSPIEIHNFILGTLPSRNPKTNTFSVRAKYRNFKQVSPWKEFAIEVPGSQKATPICYAISKITQPEAVVKFEEIFFIDKTDRSKITEFEIVDKTTHLNKKGEDISGFWMSNGKKLSANKPHVFMADKVSDLSFTSAQKGTGKVHDYCLMRARFGADKEWSPHFRAVLTSE